MVICVKRISEKCFSFNNVNTSLNSFEHSEGYRRAIRHLGTQRANGHLEGTRRAFRHLGRSSTQGTQGNQALGSTGTRALEHSRHLDAFRYLFSKCFQGTKTTYSSFKENDFYKHRNQKTKTKQFCGFGNQLSHGNDFKQQTMVNQMEDWCTLKLDKYFINWEVLSEL